MRRRVRAEPCRSDEHFVFMGDVSSEAAANNAMPRGVKLLIEFFLDEASDFLAYFSMAEDAISIACCCMSAV